MIKLHQSHCSLCFRATDICVSFLLYYLDNIIIEHCELEISEISFDYIRYLLETDVHIVTKLFRCNVIQI